MIIDARIRTAHVNRHYEWASASRSNCGGPSFLYKISPGPVNPFDLAARSYLSCLFLYFQWPTLDYMPGLYHFSILNMVYTHTRVLNYFTTLQSLRRGYIWCQ